MNILQYQKLFFKSNCKLVHWLILPTRSFLLLLSPILRNSLSILDASEISLAEVTYEWKPAVPVFLCPAYST